MVEGSTTTAKRCCQHCPVVVECLEQALDEPGLHGVWGGMTDIERRRERQRRATR
jgi:WhiB family redox-sensing transcriptional regulator